MLNSQRIKEGTNYVLRSANHFACFGRDGDGFDDGNGEKAQEQLAGSTQDFINR